MHLLYRSNKQVEEIQYNIKKKLQFYRPKDLKKKFASSTIVLKD